MRGMNSIDEYIAQFEPAIQDRLQAMRNAIRRAAPDAGEKISYGMPAFVLYGNLVHFAAMKHHIGFYPGASGVEVFKNRLAGFGTSKGAIRFLWNQPLPLDLVDEIVRYRVHENTQIAISKGQLK